MYIGKIMDFFNSLSQVVKNQDNFKKWEQNQKNEQAQRDELYKRRQYSDAELAQAKALGEEIIDIVDIMDNHSESVAENVETATEPLIGIIPFAVLLGSAFLNAKFVHQRNYTKINNTRTNLLKDEKVINLWNKITESLNNKNAYNYKNPRQLTNKRFVKKIPDASLRREAEEILKKFTKETAKFNRAIKIGWIAVGAAYLASFIGANIYASKLQVDSSKIARYQARKSLEDAKNFVIYTPEQIQQAKEELAKHPERKKEKLKEKLKSGMFKSIINIIKDRKAYKNSIKNNTDESKKVTRELSSEELIQAKKDKDVIQRTVRLINNEAEKYSQNMEVAAGVLINGTPFLGAAIGAILSALLNKAGILTKFVDKKVSQNTSDETKKLYQSLKKGKESGATYSFKWNKFANSYMNDMENLEYKNGIHNTRKAISISDKAKQMFTVAMAHKKGRHWLISGISAFITGIAGLLIGLKLQKSAARAGRYNAKRELEKDPSNFIGYTEDDYNEVKDVKYTGKDKSKIKEVITFIPTV